jgi:exopolysaccharide production protein ExoZ
VTGLPRSTKLVSVQYLRALAVTLILFHHARVPANWLFDPFANLNLGSGGIDVFFVVSGFVMFVAAGHEKPLDFCRRRIVRIVPLYWAAIAFFFLLSLCGGYMRPAGIGQIVESALFIPHYNPFYPHRLWPYVIQGWTLDYEMYFYAIFAIGLALKRPLVFPILALAVVLIAANLISSDNAIVVFAREPAVLEFAAGLLIGKLYSSREIRHLGFLAVIGFVLLLFSDFTFRLGVLSAGIPAVLLLVGGLSLEPWLAKHEWRWLRLAGDASYSIYLFHPFPLFVLAFLYQQLPLTGWPQFIGYVVLSIAVGTLSGMLIYTFAEKPLLSLARSLIGPPPKSAAA